MTMRAFKEVKFKPDNLVKLKYANEIINEYLANGYSLTLRQLYYQLVSRGLIPNNDAEYKSLGNIIAKGRLGGLVDWDAIEDRLRKPYIPYYAYDKADAIHDTIRSYRLDRQEGQDNHVELWVEKDALSSVFKRVTSKYHIPLMVNRGYASITAIYDAFKKFSNRIDDGQEVHILYFGDHDPSGLDMIRDVKNRIGMMLADEFGDDDMFYVHPVGLTMEQIKKYNPPPNPAKLSDVRAKDYIKHHGKLSWEIDALPPDVLSDLATNAIESLIDLSKYQDQLDQEKLDIKELKKLENTFKEERN